MYSWNRHKKEDVNYERFQDMKGITTYGHYIHLLMRHKKPTIKRWILSLGPAIFLLPCAGPQTVTTHRTENRTINRKHSSKIEKPELFLDKDNLDSRFWFLNLWMEHISGSQELQTYGSHISYKTNQSSTRREIRWVVIKDESQISVWKLQHYY